jgi:hypothetical protein
MIGIAENDVPREMAVHSLVTLLRRTVSLPARHPCKGNANRQNADRSQEHREARATSHVEDPREQRGRLIYVVFCTARSAVKQITK